MRNDLFPPRGREGEREEGRRPDERAAEEERAGARRREARGANKRQQQLQRRRRRRRREGEKRLSLEADSRERKGHARGLPQFRLRASESFYIDIYKK